VSFDEIAPCPHSIF
jgi:hypothetical protein